VLALGDARDELRSRSADVLEPVLRTAGKHVDLVKALELRLRAQTEHAERATTLRALASVHESWLADAGSALDCLLRALGEVPSEVALHDEAERVANMLGKDGWRRLEGALGDRAASIFDARVTAALFLRIGLIAERQLDDLPRAAEAFARSAEQGGDGPEVLEALERVYARQGDSRALAEVIERRIGVETLPSAQADLLHRLASLQVGPLEDKAQGLATLRLALERDPSHDKSRLAVEALLGEEALFDEVFDTLETVYRASSRGADLGRLYERKVDRAPSQQARTRARLALARVLEKDANDAAGAQRALAAAVLDDPADPDVVLELERIAERTGAWSDAADALGRALEAAERAAKQAAAAGESAPSAASSALWSRLGHWRRDKVEDYRGAELAFTKALDDDRDNVDLVRAVEELTRGPGRERDRVAVLRRLIRLEGDPARKRELCREVVDTAENVLADSRLAEDALKELLEENESDGWAYEQLTRLREEASDHEQVIALLEKRAQLAAGDEAAALRHRAAEVAAEKLSDRPRAIGIYAQLFADDASDTRACDRLRTLYAATERHEDLAKLLRQLAPAAASVSERAALRIELAHLVLERFAATQDAVDTLRAVLEEDPDHEAAAAELARVLDAAGRHGELAELTTTGALRAKERGDAEAEIAARLRLGEILELKVGDAGAALEAYEEVIAKDPDRRDGLEAVARLAEGRARWDRASAALARLVQTATGEAAVGLSLRLAKAREELGDVPGVEQALEGALAFEMTNTDVRARLAKVYERTNKWSELASLLVGDADAVRDAHGEEPATGTMASLAPPPPAGAASRVSVPPPGAVPPHTASQVRLLRRAADLHAKQRSAPGDAVPLLERAARLVPNDRELLLALCDAYSASSRDRDAATVLEKIIAGFGGKRSKDLSVYHHRLGRALSSLGEKPQSLVQYDMAFKIDPGSIEVLRDLGVLAIETNDLERAQKTFRALLLQKLEPGAGISKGEVFTYLGEISLKQGDKVKAVQMLERAVENEPGLARARQMLTELKG
jgi:tetratricopeptide (TPR) repeat protein